MKVETRYNEPDSPLLGKHQCRVTNVVAISSGMPRELRPPQSLHCCNPVVNAEWQLCKQHNKDRERLL